MFLRYMFKLILTSFIYRYLHTMYGKDQTMRCIPFLSILFGMTFEFMMLSIKKQSRDTNVKETLYLVYLPTFKAPFLNNFAKKHCINIFWFSFHKNLKLPLNLYIYPYEWIYKDVKYVWKFAELFQTLVKCYMKTNKLIGTKLLLT